jgi:hypothetical protein
MGAIGEDASTLNVKILDAIYRRDLENHNCSFLSNKTPIRASFRKQAKPIFGQLGFSPGNSKQVPVTLNEKTTKRLLNQEVLNEIYYKKSWDAFLASKTDQELELAHKFSVSTYKANNGLGNMQKNSHSKTLEIIDSKILEEKRTNIKNNIMMSYKNVKNSFDQAKCPLNEGEVKERILVSLSNIHQGQLKEYSYERDVDNVIQGYMQELRRQNLILKKLKKKRSKLNHS